MAFISAITFADSSTPSDFCSVANDARNSTERSVEILENSPNVSKNSNERHEMNTLIRALVTKTTKEALGVLDKNQQPSDWVKFYQALFLAGMISGTVDLLPNPADLKKAREILEALGNSHPRNGAFPFFSAQVAIIQGSPNHKEQLQQAQDKAAFSYVHVKSLTTTSK